MNQLLLLSLIQYWILIDLHTQLHYLLDVDCWHCPSKADLVKEADAGHFEAS